MGRSASADVETNMNQFHKYSSKYECSVQHNVLCVLRVACNYHYHAKLLFTGSIIGGNSVSGEWPNPIWAGRGEASDMGDMVSNIARSMTNNICQTAQAPVDSKNTGQAFQLNVVVHVIWAWLVLPVLLDTCSAVFLVLSVSQTRSSRVNDWKSSPLAVLFSGIEVKLRNTLRMAWILLVAW
jgi:hypothetical protein